MQKAERGVADRKRGIEKISEFNEKNYGQWTGCKKGERSEKISGIMKNL